MGWLKSIFGKRTARAPRNVTKITELTDDEKAELDDQIADGVPNRDIAQSLGLSIGLVRNYRRSTNPRASADDELAEARRQIQLETLQMQLDQIRAERKALQEEMQGDEEEQDPIDAALMSILTPMLSRFTNQNTQIPAVVTAPPAVAAASLSATSPPPQEPPKAGTVNLTNEQIEPIIRRLTKTQLTMARIAPESVIASTVLKEFPEVDQDTANRAAALIKKEASK